jgi:hypothetical protein
VAINGRAALLFLLSFSCGTSFDQAIAAGQSGEKQASVEGVWRGHSVYEDKNSACHDEVNVYRFVAVAGKANTFIVTASKVVDGKEIVMGSGEWKYDEKTRTVECQSPAIRLLLEGKKMEGALRIEDGTVYRRIYLAKQG